MVHARKGHVDELQVLAGADDLALEGHVGDHEDVRVLGALDLDVHVHVARIGRKLVALFFQLLGVGGEEFVGDAEGLQQHDLHW